MARMDILYGTLFILLWLTALRCVDVSVYLSSAAITQLCNTFTCWGKSCANQMTFTLQRYHSPIYQSNVNKFMLQIYVLETGNVTGQNILDLLPASICVQVVNSFPHPFPGLLYPRFPMLDTYKSDHICGTLFKIIFLCMGLLFYLENQEGTGVGVYQDVLKYSRETKYIFLFLNFKRQ